ncbi:hypothetical protein H0G86_009305 [Trichoderma simmonsii]|uniref:Uncharacterized protein n=1 Tax=Trichoderma simmonsii TaxID=1491479 RepID=A0A8G0LK83_9HYPO|nr:hypothetical protein H0G86_009305 [Trichoderma simmonsii]
MLPDQVVTKSLPLLRYLDYGVMQSNSASSLWELDGTPVILVPGNRRQGRKSPFMG